MVNIKFAGIVEHDGEVNVASGIIMNCPSEEALREKLESQGVAIFHMEEATQEEIDEAEEA